MSIDTVVATGLTIILIAWIIFAIVRWLDAPPTDEF